jgi:antirestriction protein ArdC
VLCRYRHKIHWTGHKSRLDRISPAAPFGSENYAVEELIAELGAAFLCAELGVSTYPRQDHANYIASWLKILKNDKKAIFHAARKATQAVDYLRKLQPPEF